MRPTIIKKPQCPGCGEFFLPVDANQQLCGVTCDALAKHNRQTEREQLEAAAYKYGADNVVKLPDVVLAADEPLDEGGNDFFDDDLEEEG